MQFELNKKNIILIVVLVALALTFAIVYNYKNPRGERKEDSKYKQLHDYSRFFAISDAADKFVNYLAREEADELYLLLDEEYKEDNNITKRNITDKLDGLEGYSYIFQAKNIYQEEISRTMMKYYVFGHIRPILLEEYIRPTEYYIIVIVDTGNWTFSIIPSDGSNFMEG